MKKYNQIILIVLCIFTLFSSFGSSVSAQPAIPSLSKPSSIILNSQPEVYVKNIVLDGKTYKAGDTVKGSFTLLNNKAQPVSDVYYKISLAGDYQKNNLAKTFYDSIKNGPFSLAGRESKKIDFIYVLPKAVAGDNLGIQVSALLGSGMPMGWGDSMIKVEGEMSLLKVSKVFISINNNKFDFQTGVDVSREDNAFLEVNLANPTKNKIEIIPKIKIYNNITPAISSELNLSTVAIPANSSSSIRYELPKFENRVGVYVGNLSFFDANGNKRALDLQFNYRIPEISNFINTDQSQNGTSTGKVYTTRDYIFFAALILLGLGLIGLAVFLVIKFKKKIVLFSFLTFLLLGGIFGFVDSARADLTVGTACTDGSVYVTPTLWAAPTYDIYQTYIQASTTCANKGSGWRLPTISELNTLYLNKNAIWGWDRCVQHNSLCGTYCYATCGPNIFWSSSSSGSKVWTESILSGWQKYTSIDANSRADARCVKTVNTSVYCSGYVLNITKVGSGSGTVTGASTYNSGISVTATATADAGSTFTGWSGDCNASGQVTMTSNKTCIANFTLFSGGDGSVANPYKISACTELQTVKNYLTSNFILINDIDCSDTVNWNSGAGFIPIGTEIQPFIGTFDGNNFNISSLYIRSALESYIGLFGHVGIGGSILNINLVNNTILGIARVAWYIGGLVGYNGGLISTSSNSGNVSQSYNSASVGGIAGYNTGSINNSCNSANVSGYSYVGGVTGVNEGSVIKSCNSGNVSGFYDQIGGLVGFNEYSSNVANSYSSGNVSGVDEVGGLVGSGYGTISNSYAIGNVSGDYYVGGFAGYHASVTISNSYSSGRVSGNKDVGGFIGINGMYFDRPGPIVYSYYDILTSGRTDVGKGIPKTTLDMKNIVNFTNWDFVNIWEICNNNYPSLRWQNNCLVDILAPSNITISTPSCSGSTVRLSWPVVPSATQYKIYKDNTFLATTTATSSDISNISTSTVLFVSAISDTGVESATSTGVSLPVGIKPTNLQISGVGLYDSLIGGNLLATEDMSPDQEFYLQGNATAENSLSQYLKMNYFSNTTGVSPWVLSGSAISSTTISSNGSTAVRSGQFSIGPFTAPSNPDNYLVSYYVSAYPYCVVDYNEASTTLIMDPANSITYTIPPSASCGSANGGTSLTVPQGLAACSSVSSQSNLRGSGSIIDPWKWDCDGANNSTVSCSATQTPLVPNTALNCSFLPTPATNQLNSTVVLTATTTPGCSSCTKKWTLIDSSNPAPGKDITGSDKTNYTLKNIFTTVGLKTITAQVFSEDGSSYGNTCTTTTNVIQGESITKEI